MGNKNHAGKLKVSNFSMGFLIKKFPPEINFSDRLKK